MQSLISSISLVQGDNSSEEIFRFTEFDDISSANWIGAYTLRNETITGDIAMQGLLGKSVDNTSFVFYLQPEETALLPVGRYFLTIELKNLVDFSQRIRLEVVQAMLTVAASGVENT